MQLRSLRCSDMGYWTSDGRNQSSAAGLPMIATDLMFAVVLDAAPRPHFRCARYIWPTAGH